MYADANGRIFDHPRLRMAGCAGGGGEAVPTEELAPMPRGSDLFTLPGRRPVGIDPDTGKLEMLDGPVTAVATFLAPAWLRLRHPVFHTMPDAPILPLYAYTAMGYADGKFWAPAVRVDPEARQDPWRFDLDVIAREVSRERSERPENKLVQQLERCALDYGCRAAQNYFLARFEAPLPASEGCNAACVGCISLQPKGSCVAAHERILKHPDPAEIADVACAHIARVDRAVVSFGQGCEGEPILRGDVLEESIRLIRQRTDRGTIHLNSNASLPGVIDRLCSAGLQSLRISMNAADPETYALYYRPRGYTFADVTESARTVKRHGGFVSLNLLVFPGVNDLEPELRALEDFMADVGIDMIQLRNLNVDVELYRKCLGPERHGRGIGFLAMMKRLSARFPKLRYGYFNPPRETFVSAA